VATYQYSLQVPNPLYDPHESVQVRYVYRGFVNPRNFSPETVKPTWKGLVEKYENAMEAWSDWAGGEELA
jgi:hypothetical protein